MLIIIPVILLLNCLNVAHSYQSSINNFIKTAKIRKNRISSMSVSLSDSNQARWPLKLQTNIEPSLQISQNMKSEESSDAWEIDLLYDSDCPICMMEVEFLKKRDIHHKIRFTDLQSDDYDPAEHGNVKFSDGMRKIRAVLPDQTVVIGVEVFRKTYDAIGLGWVFELTKLPVIGYLADALYDIWAENRLRLTGRAQKADELREQAEILRNLDFEDCNTDACGIDYDEL